MLLKKLLFVAGVLACLIGWHDKALGAADREDSGFSLPGPLAAVFSGHEIGH